MIFGKTPWAPLRRKWLIYWPGPKLQHAAVITALVSPWRLAFSTDHARIPVTVGVAEIWVPLHDLFDDYAEAMTQLERRKTLAILRGDGE